MSKLSKGAGEIVDIVFGEDKEEIAFEFNGKDGGKIVTSYFEEPKEGHYKNDLIRLKTTSKFKSGDIDVLMTPYEAMIIANGLHQAILFHKKSMKRFLK